MPEEQGAFGAELRRRRMAAGLSLAMLGKKVHYSKGYLGRIETGGKVPRIDLARRLDAVLDADGQLVALAEKPLAANPPTAATPGRDGDVWVMGMAPDGSSWVVPTPQDEAPGTSSMLGLRLGIKGISAAAQRDATVMAFRALFDLVRQLGQTMSPSVVLPTAIAQTNTLRGMASMASSPAREELLRLAARYCEYVGWMAQEAGDEKGALWWTRAAVEMGTAAGDTELATYALIRQALITLYRDDATSTIDLARQAQLDPRTSPRVRGLAALREAQGHALACDYDQCHRALDRATGLLDEPGDSESGDLVIGSASVTGSGLRSLVEGWCLYDLGHPAQAADILDRQLPFLATTAHRAHARFSARQALAYAAAGEIDHASMLTGRVLDAADIVDSATVRQDLRHLTRVLTRWRSHQSVRDVYPRLNAALHTPIP